MSLQEQKKSLLSFCLDPSLHISYLETIKKLEQWNHRFPHKIKDSIFNDLCFFYLHNTKEYLTLRSSWHIFRLILSIHLMKERISYQTAFHPNNRHLEIRCVYSSLTFPFISKSVLGCLVGCNLFDRYEIFDKENILLTARKYIPNIKFVKESLYQHPCKDENLKIIYLEMEKEGESRISLQERSMLQEGLERKMKNSIQRLSPMVFMGSNKEDIYKTLVASHREIETTSDIPQVHIVLDRQTNKEIIEKILLGRFSTEALQIAVSTNYACMIFQAPCKALAMMSQVFVGRWYGANERFKIGSGIWAVYLVFFAFYVHYGAFRNVVW